MADGRHLEKSKTAISLQRLDRSAQNMARCRILTSKLRDSPPASALKRGATPLSIGTKMFDLE